jgi:CBS-domain-containing membrane protein
MTDLSKIGVVVMRPDIPMNRANAKMIKYGVRMLLVLDYNEQMAGLLTASDVLGEKPISHLQRMGGTNADILVSDIMTPLGELEVMHIQDVKHARVGNIVATLKQAHRQHTMVISEDANGHQTVCGLFSITQIARQLGAKVQSFNLDRTFAEIEAVVAHK